MSEPVFFEDFYPGQTFTSSAQLMDLETIITFAKAFDPQPQHIDVEAAKGTLFGTLIASGWHTGSVAMRQKLETPLGRVATGLVGMGLEQVRWPRPVYPNDTIHSIVHILETRASSSRPEKGVVKYRVETLNQKGELVMEMTTAVLMPRKTA